ncbi:probable maltase [Ylistrum balloti]|uniref:probable maltase n=1 Tax=Ylistrum balloti TaxID=509963 RepID=UPI002905958B|nr:probable maltase [Ylistrum balloti]
MAETNSLDEEKKGLTDMNDSATVEIDQDDSTVKFLNGGKGIDAKADSGSGDISFTGLGKEELMKYADDPFWKKVRICLFVLFWVGWVAMLVAAIVIIVLAPRCPYRPDSKWYDENTMYQVYPRSFKDSSKSQSTDPSAGVGDLEGLSSKLPYLKELGMKSLYISSFFKSGNQDHGMDVVDHKDIDSIFGTLDQFKAIRKETKNELRIILDFIPNHTSRNHTWFEMSKKKDAKYKDFYVWASCTPTTKPNNWLSVYGGSAWEYDEERKECYYHTYLKEEPDLNLANPDVLKEMDAILRFWLDLGVDGFNVIGAQHLVESNNTANETLSGLPVAATDYAYLDHTLTRNQPESIALINRWRSVADSYATKPGKEKMLMVAASGTMNETSLYYGTSDKKGANFVLTSPVDFSRSVTAYEIELRVREFIEAGQVKRAWSYGNQDESRLATKAGRKMVKAMFALQMLLPGIPVNYYGNEIGMENGNIPYQDRQDFLMKDVSLVNYDQSKSRDPFRTPMQWTSGLNAGFSENKPWLPVNSNSVDTVNVETENAYFSDRNMDETQLYAFRNLSGIREKESFQWGKTTIGTVQDSLWFKRHAEGFPGFVVLINLGSSSQTVKMNKVASVPAQVELVFHSQYKITEMEKNLDFNEKSVSINPGQVLVFQFE